MLGRFIQCREDSLTASVFSHLLHLPIERFWKILRGACYTTQLPETVGEPYLVALWPRWDAAGTSNEREVIPDLFLRFPGLDLLVEAKRWDEGMQHRPQWEREVRAYANEYANEGARAVVRMIALGGLHGNEDDVVTIDWEDASAAKPGITRTQIVCPVHMCRWRRLLEECQRMERELRQEKTAQARAHRRILMDLVGLFAAHGFRTGEWFAEMGPRLPKLPASTAAAHVALTALHRQPSRL